MVVFHSRPQPISIPRNAVVLNEATTNDNAEMDISRFSHSYAPPPSTFVPPPPVQQHQSLPPLPPSSAPMGSIPPWGLVGVRVRASDGLTGVLTEVQSSHCTVRMDEGGSRSMPFSELQPLVGCAAGQEVVVLDNPNNPQRATIVKVDGEDLVIRIGETNSMVRNTAVVDPSVFPSNDY